MFNTESVKTLAHSNPTASAIFLAFSQRERGRHVINLDLFWSRLASEGVKLVHDDFFGTFRQLEQIGVGRLVYGRKGNPNCFIWSYDLKDVAKIGLGSHNVEPKTVKPRAPRGVNRTLIPANPPQRIMPAMPAPKQAKPAKQAKPKEVEALVPVKRDGRKKYVHISIPIEMLKLLKVQG